MAGSSAARTSFVVAQSGEETDIPIAEAKSSLSSLKERLAAKRAEATDALFVRYPVPRLEMVVVEYGPVDQKVWNGILEAAEKQKGVTPMQINSRLLAAFVRGVYADDDGTLVSIDTDNPDEPAPHFNERLAGALDVDWPGSQGEMVRKLYLTDFDVISTAAALLEFSGFGKASDVEASARPN